jgi:thiazole synthase
MEWGFDGVLLNTAVSRASDPIRMAKAFADSVRAGRGAFLAGPMAAQEFAVPSTQSLDVRSLQIHSWWQAARQFLLNL